MRVSRGAEESEGGYLQREGGSRAHGDRQRGSAVQGLRRVRGRREACAREGWLSRGGRSARGLQVSEDEIYTWADPASPR